MPKRVKDVISELGYYQLYEKAEKELWKMAELPWEQLDKSQVDEQLLKMVKTAAYAELTTFYAALSYLQLFIDDVDLTQWFAVWFYEETKHPHVFMKWLSCFDVKLDENFLKEGRKIYPLPESKVERLAFNMIAEIIASNMYIGLSKRTKEPVLIQIAKNLARDEMRHSRGFEYYCKKAIVNCDDPDKEKLICLRALWFLLEKSKRSSDQQVPVLMIFDGMEGLADNNFWENVKTQIVVRFSKMLDIPLKEPGEVYDVYKDFKKEYKLKTRKNK